MTNGTGYTFLLRQESRKTMLALSAKDARQQNEQVFRKHLNLAASLAESASVQASVDKNVKDFVAYVHHHADWYNRKVIKERFWQHVYLVFSIALVVLIPIAISFGVPALVELSQYKDSTGQSETSVGVVTAQLTSALTSLIALQRVLGAWMGRRKVLGRRWEARTALIRLIYELEQRHGDRVEKANTESRRKKVIKELGQDLRATLVLARDIVNDETQAFFDNYALPEIDAGQSILSAQSVATRIVGGLQAPIESALSKNRKRREEFTRIEQDIRTVSSEIDYLQGEFDAACASVSNLGGIEGRPNDAQSREVFLRDFNSMKSIEAEIAKKQNKRLELELRRKIATI